MNRLRRAVGKTPLHVFSFEEDRATGNLGCSLYSLIGISEELQHQFPPMDALNVTRLSTVDPSWEDDDLE